MDRSLSDSELVALAERLGQVLKRDGRLLTVAESCTGGWLGRVITSVPGSSGWFERGFVTYSDRSKIEMLGVPPQLLAAYGAVSEPIVLAMAEGALARSHAQVAVAVTGIAGPDGGSAEKPVGTVWFAWEIKGRPAQVQRHLLTGDREAVRRQSVAIALEGLYRLEA